MYCSKKALVRVLGPEKGVVGFSIEPEVEFWDSFHVIEENKFYVFICFLLSSKKYSKRSLYLSFIIHKVLPTVL